MSVYTVIHDPTTGEPMLSVCTKASLAPEEIEALQALQLWRLKQRTPEQQMWLDRTLAEDGSDD